MESFNPQGLLDPQEVLLFMEPLLEKWTSHFHGKELREEARQVARIACWKRLPHYDGTRGKSLTSYLFMVVRSALINWYHSERRYRETHLLPLPTSDEEDGGSWEERVADPSPDSFGEDLIWEAWMAVLTERESLCLTLHIRDGYSLFQVAELCQVPYERVKKWKQRGLSRLRKLAKRGVPEFVSK